MCVCVCVPRKDLQTRQILVELFRGQLSEVGAGQTLTTCVVVWLCVCVFVFVWVWVFGSTWELGDLGLPQLEVHRQPHTRARTHTHPHPHTHAHTLTCQP